MDLHVADGIIDGNPPRDCLGVRRRRPRLEVVEDGVVVEGRDPLERVVVANGQVGHVPDQVVVAADQVEVPSDPDASLLGREVDLPAEAVGVELPVLAADPVAVAEEGLQHQFVAHLDPAVPFAHVDREVVRGSGGRVEPEAVVAVAAGVPGDVPRGADVVLGAIVKVAEIEAHEVGADVQWLGVADPGPSLEGFDAHRAEGSGLGAARAGP